jgi:hypothetical protein
VKGDARDPAGANLLTTMAILLANYDSDRDYLSNLEPFVADRLKQWPAETPVAPKALCSALTAAYNLPRIPINTVTQLRDRAHRSGYLRRDASRRFFPNLRTLAEVKSLAPRESVFLDHFERLTEEVRLYATDVHDLSWDQPEAEKALEGFAQAFGVELAMARRKGGLDDVGVERRREEMTVMHGFARRALEEDRRCLDYLEEVVQASMLTNVLYLQDLSTQKPNLKDLVVYFDTTVAFRALAMTDEEVSEAAQEMVELLSEFDVPVRVFEHTFDEMRGVLRGVRECLREQGRSRTNLDMIPRQGFEVLSYALRAGWGPADAEEAAIELEARLASLCVAVAAAPRANPSRRLDERGLDQLLADRKFSERQRSRDIDSLRAIDVLREGRRSASDLGKARAIFITSNEALVKAAWQWFGEGGVPHCVTETSFTTQLWLRRPAGRPDVALKFLAAGSHAALTPSPQLWEQYLDRIAQRRDRAEITEQQVKALVFSAEAKQSLAEAAQGDPEQVNDQAIGEVLARSHDFLPAAFARRLESAGADIRSLRDENRSMQEEIAERDIRLHEQAELLAVQNREIAMLHLKLEELIGSRERHDVWQRRAASQRLLARRGVCFGIGVVLIALVAQSALAGAGVRWPGAAGIAAGGIAIGSVFAAVSRDWRWTMLAMVLVGAVLPALLLDLIPVDEGAAAAPAAAELSVETPAMETTVSEAVTRSER